MCNLYSLSVALAGLSAVSSIQAGVFADSILSYESGSGFAPGFTNANSALGEPSRITPGPFGGPVDPFSPPFLGSQLVSVGAGGSLLVQFAAPILNSPANPFGLDFLVFGNSGFVITNGDFSGGGITDGSLFSHNTGMTRISVSADNLTYYLLNPALTPVVDGLHPTDGSGDFQKPVDPALNTEAFAGKDLAGIRALYDGSGGGTGFDISWAQDANGQAVLLPSIRFIRVDVLSGKSEIDGFVAVPEPATWALLGLGAGLCFAVRCRRRTKPHLFTRSATGPRSR